MRLLSLILLNILAFSSMSCAQKSGEPVASDIKPGTLRKNSIGMELVWIPPGVFMMGSTDAQIDVTIDAYKRLGIEFTRSGYVDETPSHSVKIADGFWMGKFEVTQAQWQTVMGTSARRQLDKLCPSCELHGEGPDYPIYNVNWYDAKEFINKLNANNDGFVYSLPSEAEWEYACRAGTTTAFAFGDSLNSTQANFDGKDYPYNSAKGAYIGKTVTVGSYRPNAWGLYDMHGNVLEWIEDIYRSYNDGVRTDRIPKINPLQPNSRVIRGGGADSDSGLLRSASRNGLNPALTLSSLGLRVVARVK